MKISGLKKVKRLYIAVVSAMVLFASTGVHATSVNYKDILDLKPPIVKPK